MGLFSSCNNYLEPYPNGDISTEDLWTFQARVQGLIGQCYDNMPLLYNNNEGVYLEGATDNAVITSSTQAMKRLATGSLTTGLDPFVTYWDRDYKSILLVNMFLKDRRGYNTKFLINPTWNDLVRSRLQGEAFALRAWFQWDLLQKFGGKGVDGQLLGFPIVTEPIEDITGVNLKRNTYEECVRQIIDDCDSAYKYLPIAHRDFLVTDPNNLVYAGGRYWGRMDGITTRAIKAMVYLTWASPRFNPGNDVARWDSAAANALKVMNFKLTVDGGVTNGFNPSKSLNWFDPNSPEIVFSARATAASDAMERLFYPGGFQGNGSIGATQELVDAFPMKSGYPINDPANRGGYNPADPYLNRDPRFYSAIFYNTAKAIRANSKPAETMYTFENWANGGKDAAGITSNNSLTNYHVKKMVFMGLNWSDNVKNKQPHSNFFIRWTHMCLIFAEAANKVVGPTDVTRYGISAKTAIQYLRARITPDGTNGLSPLVPLASDAYLTEVTNAGANAFDALVKNERRIETCFEGMRFYDLRRWTTSLTELNKSVHGAGITRNTDGVTFTYVLNNEVEARSYSSAYLPLPYSEILKMSNLVQNEGWDGWN
jgi:starch-binding outer membrane protein, SusD/RagB family